MWHGEEFLKENKAQISWKHQNGTWRCWFPSFLFWFFFHSIAREKTPKIPVNDRPNVACRPSLLTPPQAAEGCRPHRRLLVVAMVCGHFVEQTVATLSHERVLNKDCINADAQCNAHGNPHETWKIMITLSQGKDRKCVICFWLVPFYQNPQLRFQSASMLHSSRADGRMSWPT